MANDSLIRYGNVEFLVVNVDDGAQRRLSPHIFFTSKNEILADVRMSTLSTTYRNLGT